mmetsp:Transcript_28745/g.42245  ORF Transcript_28745/g.42245 Transcript_28745/m.42245 type:complete len:83 (-) Transcript_28745:171-419(-)
MEKVIENMAVAMSWLPYTIVQKKKSFFDSGISFFKFLGLFRNRALSERYFYPAGPGGSWNCSSWLSHSYCNTLQNTATHCSS